MRGVLARLVLVGVRCALSPFWRACCVVHGPLQQPSEMLLAW